VETIQLRPATAQDGKLLLEWRNNSDTRGASHDTREVLEEAHLSWLRATLHNANRQLLIAEEDGVPVGTVRSDFADGVHELSWTVAPDSRGRGVGRRMVTLAASQVSTPIRAEVKSDNLSSVRIAERAGMVLEREANGILHFSRAALTR
jgi:RimJ/RimL family protein N-acetyltransferase